MKMTAIVVTARVATTAEFSISQSDASASTKDTLLGQVANALATQTELNLQMNITVKVAFGFG